MMYRWVWALIMAGIFFHGPVFADAQWTKMDVPETYANTTFNDIWGTSSDNLFAVGTNNSDGKGVILRFNGAVWKKMNTDDSGALNCIWGSSGSDIFAGGGNNVILHFNGSGWKTMDHPNFTNNICEDIWGVSGSEVYAAGFGRVLRYDGERWRIISNTNMLDYHFMCVWGGSGADLYAAGYYYDFGVENYIVMHYDGSLWTQSASGGVGRLMDIWGSSASDIYAVGDPGILYFNGLSWSSLDDAAGVNENVYAIWGSSASKILAGKSDGDIFAFDGSSWNDMQSENTNPILNIWGLSPENIYAAGDSGTILQYADDASGSDGDGTGSGGSSGGGCFISAASK